MDRTEEFLHSELPLTKGQPEMNLDVDQLIEGTNKRIRTRALRRKTLFTTPIAVLLIMMVYVVIPRGNDSVLMQGSELFMAGWESSWTEEQVQVASETTLDLYDQSVDYLIDESYYSYAEEAAELLDDSELEEFYGYLKEV